MKAGRQVIKPIGRQAIDQKPIMSSSAPQQLHMYLNVFFFFLSYFYFFMNELILRVMLQIIGQVNKYLELSNQHVSLHGRQERVHRVGVRFVGV